MSILELVDGTYQVGGDRRTGRAPARSSANIVGSSSTDIIAPKLRNQVIQGDCIEVLQGFPQEIFDMILTDPPYGIDFWSNRSDAHERIKNDDYENWRVSLPKWFEEMKRVLKSKGVCIYFAPGGNKFPVTIEMTGEFIKYFHFINSVSWDKMVLGTGWKYRNQYEIILVGGKSKVYNFYDSSKSLSNVVRCRRITPGRNSHPTPKPVNLLKHFVRIHSRPGDLILDPFCGGGSTLIACRELGRDFVGIEIEHEFVQLAKWNLASAMMEFSFEEQI